MRRAHFQIVARIVLPMGRHVAEGEVMAVLQEVALREGHGEAVEAVLQTLMQRVQQRRLGEQPLVERHQGGVEGERPILLLTPPGLPLGMLPRVHPIPILRHLLGMHPPALPIPMLILVVHLHGMLVREHRTHTETIAVLLLQGAAGARIPPLGAVQLRDDLVKLHGVVQLRDGQARATVSGVATVGRLRATSRPSLG